MNRFLLVAISVADNLSAAEAYGAGLLLPYKQGLKQALVAGMREGPVVAVDACRIQAPEVASGLSVDGVKVGRSSKRLRNPANEPKPWMQTLLQEWQELENRKPAIVELENATYGYAEPIILQPMCRTCHGEVIAPELQQVIAARYPDDRATGFRPGDLRGMFWVEFPKAAVEPD